MGIITNLVAIDPASPLLDEDAWDDPDEMFEAMFDYCDGGQDHVVMLYPNEAAVDAILRPVLASVVGDRALWSAGQPLDHFDDDVLLFEVPATAAIAAALSNKLGPTTGEARTTAEQTVHDVARLFADAAAREWAVITQLSY